MKLFARSSSVSVRRAFTLIELIAVIAIIALLVALLLPALKVAKANSEWAASQNNMRQIALLMQGYTGDNRGHVLPSQFDHRPISGVTYKGPMRTMMPVTPGGVPTELPPIGTRLVGTWADILWSESKFGGFVMPKLVNGDPVLGPGGEPEPGFYDYRYDSPDRAVYTEYGGFTANIFRSTVGMKRPFSLDETSEALPWGPGASNREFNHPGYFAANNFFNAAPWLGAGSVGVPQPGQLAKYYPASQILYPSAAVYLVDSRAGETIEPLPGPWQGTPTVGSTDDFCQVDFRYPGESCIMLCLDGHVQTETKWDKIEDLQGPYFASPAEPPPPAPTDPEIRGLKISNLDKPDNPAP